MGGEMAHEHSHAPVNGTEGHFKRLIVTLALTATILVAEVVGAALTGSLALLVDAGHMTTDVAVLTASTVTAALMRRKPDKSKTWGWARLEIITAAGGGLVLMFVGLYALIEAVLRLTGVESESVHDVRLLLFFGILGLASNIGSMFVLRAQSNDNMNMRAAFLEVCNDALGSVAVIISSIVLMCTGWSGFDAIAGALIALLMIPRAYGCSTMRCVCCSRRRRMVSISTRCASTCWACRTFWPCMICMRASSPPACPFSPRTSLLSRI